MLLRRMAWSLLVACTWSHASQGRSAELLNTAPNDPAAFDTAPLEALPQSTAVVLRIASIDKIASGFKELVGALGPAAAVAGSRFEAGLGELFQVGAASGAIDTSVPCYVAVFPIEGQPEPVAYIARTADEAKLRRAVLKAGPDENLPAENVGGGFEKLVKNDRTWFFGRHGDWVLYTRHEQVSRQLSLDRTQVSSFASLIEPRAAELVAAGDGAIFVNLQDLTQHYSNEISHGRDQVMSFIQALPDEQLGGNGASPEAVRRVLQDVAKLAFDSLGDAKWFAGRVNFSAAGASIGGLLGVKDASGIDALLAANPPSDFETLGLLPAGAPVYFGHFVNYQQLMTWVAERLKGSFGTDSENSQAEAALAALGSAGAGPSVTRVALPADARSGQLTTSLRQAEQPDVLRQGRRGLQVAQARNGGLRVNNTPVETQTVEYQEGAETYQERPVDLMTTKIEMAKVDDQGLLVAQQFLRIFFGGEALQTRISALEGLLVEASGNDPKYFHQAVDSLGTGEGVLGLDESFAKTRDQLAPQANVIALVNAPQLVVDIVKLLREVPLIAGFLGQVPFNFGVQPAASFAGFTAGTEPQGLRVQVFVPVAQPRGVLQIFGQGF